MSPCINPDTILKIAPKLLISVLEGNAIPPDKPIMINPFGPMNGQSMRVREKSDYATFFGSYNHLMEE
jgi:hypothetical protein